MRCSDWRALTLALLGFGLSESFARAQCPTVERWTGWSAIPGGAKIDHGPAIAILGHDMYVFGVRAGKLFYNRRDTGTTRWTGWQAVPGGGTTDRSVAAAAHRDTLYLFAKGGADRRIYLNRLNAVTSIWSGWSPIGNTVTNHAPAAAATAEAVFAVLVRSDGQAAYARARHPGTSWSPFQTIPGGRATNVPLGASGRDRRVYVSQTGLDGRVRVNQLDLSSGQWGVWSETDGVTNAGVGLEAGPSALTLVRRDPSTGHQHVKRYDWRQNQWTIWQSVGGGGSTPLMSAVASVSDKMFVASAGGDDKQIYFNELSGDADCDGAFDSDEETLLARFRPYYRLSLDGGSDPYLATDALWVVRNSMLLDAPATGSVVILPQPVLSAQPLRLLGVSTLSWGHSDLTKGPYSVTPYQLAIAQYALKGGTGAYTVMREGVGLYGHVVPLRERRETPAAITGYKIEYWQFYAFNDAIVDGFRHEGDWESVQLVVEPDMRTIRRVIHEVHGRQIVFDLVGATVVDLTGDVKEYRKRNYRLSFSLHTDGPAGIGLERISTGPNRRGIPKGLKV